MSLSNEECDMPTAFLTSKHETHLSDTGQSGDRRTANVFVNGAGLSSALFEEHPCPHCQPSHALRSTEA